MEFSDYSLENLKKIAPIVAKSKLLCNDVSIGSFLLWNKGFDLAFAVVDETLIVRQNVSGEPSYSYPVGKNEEGALLALAEYAKEKDIPLMIYGAEKEQVGTIGRVLSRPILFAYERKWSDYLYRIEDVRAFAGKKYAGQRNHIHKFEKTYPDHLFRKIEKEDLPAVAGFLGEYAKEHEDGGIEEKSELLQTKELLDALFDFPFESGVLFVEGKIAAITVGEIVGEMLIIHTEKALRRYEGVYPTIFHLFVNSVRNENLRYVNREDDSDDLGLRTSKMQYHPCFLVDKYLVKVDSPVSRLKEIPVLKGEKVVLRPFREEDKPAYLALSTDEENNKFWGYDYREDESITGKVDENTFYDQQAFDYSVGNSVNFAVTLDGRMIGESIVYRFTMGGKAEIGCRIAKERHGHGYGEEAFALTKRFAEETLGVLPVARCYRENTPSAKMIEASGMRKTGEDESFFYYSAKD